MADTLWWLLVVLLIGAGLVGTVLPALPGTALILAGLVLGAWIDGFARVSVPTLVLVAALAVLSWLLEAVAGVLGRAQGRCQPLGAGGRHAGHCAGLVDEPGGRALNAAGGCCAG